MYLSQLKKKGGGNYLAQNVRSAEVEKLSPKLLLVSSHLILTTLCSLTPIFQKGKLRFRLVTELVGSAQCCLPARPVLLNPCSLLSVFLRQLMAVALQGIPRQAVLRAPWL